MSKAAQATMSRAQQVNQDTSIYGTFAEIGAGQEVARHFFQAGQAAQTIAKTMSAYDMVYSDEIYGKEANGRYVCESRLGKMLDKEFQLLIRRLATGRGERSRFFAYANTVTTGDQTKRSCHGWMGVRFQTHPGGEANDVVLHVRMLDKYRLQQQEALGILGANLVWAAYFATQDPKDLIPALTANLKSGQVAIDLIRCSGPDLAKFNNHLLNLELVKRGLSEAILFGPSGDILSASDTLFGRSILIDRGEFRPVTTSHLNLIDKGLAQFPKNFPEAPAPTVLFELTMSQLRDENAGEIDEQDFLDRVQTLCALGHHVLVSNFFLYYRLKRYLRTMTKQPIGILLAARHMQRLFDESHYRDLEGGLLEGLGKLLDSQTRVYVCPQKQGDQCLLAESFAPPPPLKSAFDYFRAQNWLTDLGGCDDMADYVSSEKAHELLEKGGDWEKVVPPAAAKVIKSKGLFGLKSK
ncbi:MAG: hypothetical protein KF767_08100 [Bdellovibrionaceae bacterium]|nr:hypothetical protein [Pseudobdellovibrionaceae bacterium]